MLESEVILTFVSSKEWHCAAWHGSTVAQCLYFDIEIP
jgi:hypothetical protein